MALHRDIYWVGRQWAVTGSGIQACDQKQKGKFDIEAARLWEDGVLESIRALKWLNSEDFEKAIAVARKYYPEPPRKTPPPAPVSRVSDRGPEEGIPKDRASKDSIPREAVPKQGVPVTLAKDPPKPMVRRFRIAD